MVKKVLILLLLCILGALGLITHRFQSNYETIYPYTYQEIIVDPEEIKEAQKADIIVLGDSAGVEFDSFLKLFQKQSAQLLRKPLKIFNWSVREEGLAHALAKVRSLKKMPLLIIYHGGLDELDRARLNPRAMNKVIKNFEFAQDEEILSSIISFPILSRFIYHPHIKPTLNDAAVPFARNLPVKTSLKTMETLYTLYKWEAQEFTNTIKIRDGRLWFIPQAYNLLERPIKSCAGNSDTKESLLKIEDMLGKGQTKQAINLLKEILKTDSTHADSYYSLGKSFLAQGSFRKAKKAFYQAMIYDCGLKRSNPLLLKILMEQVEKNGFKVIDFNRLVTSNLGQRLMFESVRTPQKIYYEQLINTLVEEFEQLIKSRQ